MYFYITAQSGEVSADCSIIAAGFVRLMELRLVCAQKWVSERSELLGPPIRAALKLCILL